ncbi:MAG TPA: serine hydrolase [Sphingobacterium sp.]|jgi:beta-lactamase class A|uniref:serine hydrolase n=1 Tax=Sphingobacterium TaxID=28453 RepID=UPI0004E5F1D7|nr:MULTISPECIES: serine hydrolase [Sphingobacterium]UXD67806.1 class A beta-lactamase-related serine hydrolase [Sphingobacterium faecium]CDS94305.1 Beta-lactamase [Sphingobacterium sp. PM2-P1-29]SJN52342.1 Beta-lactamase [Sphingobacterium faecium PCAi_F2.5]HCU45179.1 serine hydrolase [Sphingobacterium sp.]
MRTKFLLILLSTICLVPYTLFAQKIDIKLERKLRVLTQNFQGDIGIYVKNLKTQKSVLIQADSIFPTASIVKVPILVGVFDKIEKGELNLDQKFTYRSSQQYGGSGLMQFFKDSTETDLSTLVGLMISYSDNVTSIWNQQLAGGGLVINELMDKLGLVNTKVNSRTVGRDDIWKKYGWGQTTPREMATLVEMIYQGKVISSKSSDQMYRYLGNIFYNERSLSQIPPYVKTASKTGSVDEARGEVVLVNAPSGDYVFCVLTNNIKDQSWTKHNEAEELTRKISHLLWNYFEPKRPYTP